MFDASHRLPRLLPLALVVGTLFTAITSDIASAATLLVTDCTDGNGSGTLRNTILAAGDSSIVEIPLMCSKISLASGSLSVTHAMTIAGQGHSLTTIDGGSALAVPLRQRVFYIVASGKVNLEGMTITHGMPADDDLIPDGGCIFAETEIYLKDAFVTDCTLSSNRDFPHGGGIFGSNNITLASSTVSGNTVANNGLQSGAGGGIYSQANLTAIYSTISGNVVKSGNSFNPSRGGGVYAKNYGSTFFIGSTVSGNSAASGAALDAHHLPASNIAVVSILNSTVSDNTSDNSAAIVAYIPAIVINSTIAFNRSGSSATAGLYSLQPITMNNSIFALNMSEADAFSIFSDVFSSSSTSPQLSGSNNLITATRNSVPLGTLSSCPKLGRLSSNGGHTQTIPLQAGSPALDAGAANGQTTDQRGAGFPRTFGAGTDIGAYERQAGVVDDVLFSSEFETKCG
jgi:hypothetical protein